MIYRSTLTLRLEVENQTVSVLRDLYLPTYFFVRGLEVVAEGGPPSYLLYQYLSPRAEHRLFPHPHPHLNTIYILDLGFDFPPSTSPLFFSYYDPTYTLPFLPYYYPLLFSFLLYL